MSETTLGRDRVTERRACRVLDQPRSTQRRCRHVPSDEPRLLKRIVELATEYEVHGFLRLGDNNILTIGRIPPVPHISNAALSG